MRNRLTELESELRRQSRRSEKNGQADVEAASLNMAGIGPRRRRKAAGRVSGAAALRAGRPRGFSAPVSYSVPEPIPVLAQPTRNACWATVYTMLHSWRRQQSMSIETALGDAGQRWLDIYNADTGLTGADKVDFVAATGLVAEPPQNPSVAGWEQMLRTYGPIWVTGDEAPGAAWAIHARIMVGIQGDGTPTGTRFTIIDPAGGRRYTETVATFLPKYEEEVRRTGYMRIQILHLPRDARLSAGQSLAYARRYAPAWAQQREPSRAKDGGAGVAVAIAGIAISYLTSSQGDVSWNLAQWRGIKKPWDRADLAGGSVYNNASVQLSSWPRVATVLGVDEIYLPLEVKWQYNGSSVANVEVLPGRANDAAGAGLSVDAHLMDDQNGYQSSRDPNVGMAAVKVTITYRFTNVVWGDLQARYEISLYGDGTHYRTGRWL